MTRTRLAARAGPARGSHHGQFVSPASTGPARLVAGRAGPLPQLRSHGSCSRAWPVRCRAPGATVPACAPGAGCGVQGREIGITLSAAMSPTWRFLHAPLARAASTGARRRHLRTHGDVAGDPRTAPTRSRSSTTARSAHSPAASLKLVTRDPDAATSWPGESAAARSAHVSAPLTVTASTSTAQAERPRRGVKRVHRVMDAPRSEAHARGVRNQLPITPRRGAHNTVHWNWPGATRPLTDPSPARPSTGHVHTGRTRSTTSQEADQHERI